MRNLIEHVKLITVHCHRVCFNLNQPVITTTGIIKTVDKELGRIHVMSHTDTNQKLKIVHSN